MKNELQQINEIVQGFLSPGEKVYTELTRTEGSSGMTGFSDAETSEYVKKIDMKSSDLSKKLMLFIDEHGEENRKYRLYFSKDEEPQLKEYSHDEIVQEFVESLQQTIKEKEFSRIELFMKFSTDEGYLTCEFLQNQHSGGKAETIESSPYMQAWTDSTIFYNMNGAVLKDLYINVDAHDVQIKSKPAQLERGWETFDPDSFGVYGAMAKRRAAIAEARNMRAEHYAAIGKVSEDVFAPLIGPIFTGGSNWPAGRPQLRVIQTEKSTVLITDGLSDCFEQKSMDKDNKYNGWSIELFMEFEGTIPFEDFNAHYSLPVLSQIAQNAINHRGFKELFDDIGPISIEFSNGQFTTEYQDNDGTFNLIMNVPSANVPASIQLNREKVLLAGCRLLTWDEYARFKGDETGEKRKELVRSFQSDGTCALSPWKP